MSGGRGVVGSAVHLLEPLAPDWLVRIVAPKPAPTPWPDMVRVAVTVTGALLAGQLIGASGLGGLLAFGALTGAFGDQGGPLRTRARRVGAGVAGAIAGLLLGRLLLPTGVLAVPVVAAAGAASAYLSAIGAVASFAGLQFLVMLAVSSGLAPGVGIGPLLGGFVLGGLWAVALSALQTLVLPDRGGPREAVLQAVDRIRDLAAALLRGDGAEAERHALAATLAGALDTVTAARAVSPGRRDDLRRLATLVVPLGELARAAADAEPARLAGLPERIDRLHALVLRAPVGEPGPAPADPRTAQALEHAERVAVDRPGGPGRRRRRPVAERLSDLAERVSGARTATFAARLALTLGAAEVLRLALPLPHAYWLLLTVAVVLKPDLGSVFARGVQRTLGTLVGAGLGVALLAVVPRGPLLLLPVAVLAFLFPLGAKRNYGMLATFVTPIVLILVDLSGEPTKGLATTRLIDTLLGAVLVLLVGYLPWPSTWRPRLGRDVAGTVDALAAYAAVAVDGPEASIAPARRRAYATLQNLRDDLQSALAEPPPRSHYAAAWWPIVGQLEQLADDLREASLIDRGELGGDTGSIRLVGALRETASAMRARRPPARATLPDTGPLADAADDVAALRRLLRGPTLTRPH